MKSTLTTDGLSELVLVIRMNMIMNNAAANPFIVYTSSRYSTASAPSNISIPVFASTRKGT